MNLDEGTPLVMIDTDDGMVVLTREQLKLRIREHLHGTGLVDALLRDRRAEAAADQR
jgi:hypothetical protein